MINSWLNEFSFGEGPQTSWEKEVCEKAVKDLVGLLKHPPGREVGIFGKWFCPMKFVRYVCVMAHEEYVYNNGILRIFFQKDNASRWRVMLMTNTGSCWNLYENSYNNNVSLDFDLNDGFRSESVPDECVTQFKEWKSSGLGGGDIFRLLSPIDVVVKK